MDDFEIFRKLAMCEDKEQMQRCIDEYNLSQKPTTNADRIRAMSDEELASWISGGAMHSDSACSFCSHNKEKTCTGRECQNKSDEDIIMEWLREPAE